MRSLKVERKPRGNPRSQRCAPPARAAKRELPEVQPGSGRRKARKPASSPRLGAPSAPLFKRPMFALTRWVCWLLCCSPPCSPAA